MFTGCRQRCLSMRVLCIPWVSGAWHSYAPWMKDFFFFCTRSISYVVIHENQLMSVPRAWSLHAQWVTECIMSTMFVCTMKKIFACTVKISCCSAQKYWFVVGTMDRSIIDCVTPIYKRIKKKRKILFLTEHTKASNFIHSILSMLPFTRFLSICRWRNSRCKWVYTLRLELHLWNKLDAVR